MTTTILNTAEMCFKGGCRLGAHPTSSVLIINNRAINLKKNGENSSNQASYLSALVAANEMCENPSPTSQSLFYQKRQHNRRFLTLLAANTHRTDA